jgi:hypothetical protein
MNQPFRVLRAAARGFGPGAGNALRAAGHSLRDTLLDTDRLRWWLACAVNRKTRSRRD